MKKIYEKPIAVHTEVSYQYAILSGSEPGEISTGDMMTKGNDVVIEDDDEEEENTVVEKRAKLFDKEIFTNGYISKVWE